VSVIIPVFNQAALTRQCLETILGRDDAEIIVADDASTDATATMLAEYGDKIKVVTHKANGGFAQSCNDGAAIARGNYLVFLNNDTVPQPGWLEALVRYADAHPQAAVVGAKLLYPNNTIQHAGVVICQDRYPRHIYTGFPADHPAVNKSRRFQIVTAACMLVRRGVFEEAGGFDTAFRNGFEDVDFCLRLGERGHQVHYCAESVVNHLESVSPGRFKRDRENVALYHRRWLDRVRPDDLDYYLADGLLSLTYEGRYPVAMGVSPLLATFDSATRDDALERTLRERSREVADLQRENTRLSFSLGAGKQTSPASDYGQLRQRIREAVAAVVPQGATVAVVSKGDSLLLDFPGRRGWHFPQTATGSYAGHHPADSRAAILHLEELRGKGAEFLLFPETAFWWLDQYREFTKHLEKHCQRLPCAEPGCRIFALGKTSPRQPRGAQAPRVTTRKAARKRVLYVCHNHPRIHPGGAEVYAFDLYEAMVGNDEFEPAFVARSSERAQAVPSSNSASRLIALPEDPNQHLLVAATADFDAFYQTARRKDLCTGEFREFLQRWQPDVVHFQHTLFLGHDFIREAREARPEAVIVYTLHEFLPICHRNGQMVKPNGALCSEALPAACHACFPDHSPAAFAARKASIQSSFALVDHFIAPSQFLLERYVAWGIPRGKIVFEDYGRREFAPLPSAKKPVYRNHFAYFGQLNPFKGVDVLLRAMQFLGTGVTAPRLAIHGANLELQNGDFQRSIHKLLESTAANVTFVGPYTQADLAARMAETDWVVVPSIWWENSPLVIQEAFGHGRPVLCSGIGGMADNVRDGVDGLHFRVGDARSLAATMQRAAATPGLWDKLAAGIAKPHSRDQHVRILTELYVRLLAERVRL
jgi:GT2 family glycosyltransferase/glycosyltransferase involved in cell wall biosynthesis